VIILYSVLFFSIVRAYCRNYQSVVNTLVMGYGDFRTSVASGRRWATEISVFTYRWMEEGVGFVVC
jgi:hypothetical protein